MHNDDPDLLQPHSLHLKNSKSLPAKLAKNQQLFCLGSKILSLLGL